MTRLLKDELNLISTDSEVLVQAMIENINDLYRQVLAGHDQDDDIKERLFYVIGAITGMINLLASCEVFDRETARELQEFFEEYISDNG